MPTTPRDVLTQALQLPPVERAELVEEILASFEFPDRQQIDAAWADEAEARIDAYDRGEVEGIPVQEVFQRLKQQANE